MELRKGRAGWRPSPSSSRYTARPSSSRPRRPVPSIYQRKTETEDRATVTRLNAINAQKERTRQRLQSKYDAKKRRERANADRIRILEQQAKA